MAKKVVIIMGSKADLEWAEKIVTVLKSFGIEAIVRIASAHKVPLKCYNLIKEYEKDNVVFITIAGMSNALSGFTDAQTHCPVIACPPYSEKFGGADLFSSIRMPSGVAPLTVISPDNAALAAAKIIGLSFPDIKEKVIAYQNKKREELETADVELLKSLEK
ncbi:MAG: AIR carboxylase family protein [Acidobacteria bacterium]|nr:AIR carboxylase family protein [Acidobacteriota bacterium]